MAQASANPNVTKANPGQVLRSSSQRVSPKSIFRHLSQHFQVVTVMVSVAEGCSLAA
jgi:hypothetical protein